MKDKKQILYERALISCIIMPVVCTILKLFGAEWFNLDKDIWWLKEMNDTITNNAVIHFIVTLSIKTINTAIICSVISKDMNKVIHKIYLVLLIVLGSILLNYFSCNGYVTFLYEFVSLMLVGYLISKKNIMEIITIIVMSIIYQMISLYIRNLGLSFEFYGFIENNLLLLDYNIMLIITYLYLKKGDVDACSVIIASFSSLVKPLWKERTNHSNQSLLNRKGE